jgi:hypothetical protein
MRIFVLTATYELRVSRKSHLRDHPMRNLVGPLVYISHYSEIYRFDTIDIDQSLIVTSFGCLILVFS